MPEVRTVEEASVGDGDRGGKWATIGGPFVSHMYLPICADEGARVVARLGLPSGLPSFQIHSRSFALNPRTIRSTGVMYSYL